MSFLYGWAIALGLAVAVPFLLHLRRRRTDRRVAFPALRYLSRAEDARSRSLVASDLLLLAVRIGLLLALALAAAGPLLGRGGARDHEPTDFALVVDNSASVGRLDGDRPLFETLRERARETLAAARPEDRVWLWPTVGEPLAAGVAAPIALEALGRLERTDGAADLATVVNRAAGALPAEGGRRREILLASDLQASALAGGAVVGGDDAPLVAFVPPPPEEANGAITSLELTGGTTVPSGAGHGVIVRTERPGGAAVPDTSAGGEAVLRLELDGRIAGAARVPWGSDATLGLPDLPTGAHEGRVEIDPSGARADDLRFFALRVVPAPAVRFLGREESFVGIGIETLREAGRLGAGPGPEVAVIEGTAAGSAPWGPASTLVFLPPADPIDLPAFNQRLAALGVEWGAAVDAGAGELALEEPDQPFSLSGVRVRSRYLLRPGTAGAAAADTVLLRTEDGEPWLVRTSGDGRVVILLASPLAPEATSLPAHPAMIPFLEALLVHWSHVATWPPSDFAAGEPLTLPAWADEVRRPDGVVEPVEGGAPWVPALAGVYAARGENGGSAREALFAANIPAPEADPRPLDPDALEELFSGRPVFTAGPDRASWEDGIFRSRRGRDAAPWLLGVALALLAVELFLATPGRARRSRASGRENVQPGSEAPSHGSS